MTGPRGPNVIKGDLKVDFVTKTDKENEKLIYDRLYSMFPDYDFIGEESSADAGKIEPLTATKTFIVDPIDGTTNFVHSNPFCCVSIGLCHNKTPVMGVVYNPDFDFHIQTNFKIIKLNLKFKVV